jgi:hypothetical protein
MKSILLPITILILFIPLPIWTYAVNQDYNRGYHDGFNQPSGNRQTGGTMQYNQGWHDGHIQLTLLPLYKQGFKDGCAYQKAGILTYDSEGTLDESVYDRHGSLQYNPQWEVGYSDGIDSCK